jgi:hypothetical protein
VNFGNLAGALAGLATNFASFQENFAREQDFASFAKSFAGALAGLVRSFAEN